jgi:hypothetical protein
VVISPTTTSAPPAKEGGSNTIIYAIGAVVLLGGAFVMYTLLQNEDKPKDSDDDRPARGLRGLHRKDTRIESYGSSRLAEADKQPRETRHVPLKERERQPERKEQQPHHSHETHRKEDDKAADGKKRNRSVLQDHESDASTLGKR